MELSTFLIPGILLLVLFILGTFLAKIYRTVGADEAMIITGAGTKGGIKVVKAGGSFVFPIIQQHENISLQVHTISVATPEVYTKQGVPIMVDGVAQIKINGEIEDITTAAEQFLGKQDQINYIANETLEGHLRAILGQMTVENIYQNRDEFAQRVQSVAATDLRKMGLHIVSFTIKNVKDKNGYLDALGVPQIEVVKRNAAIATADNERDTIIAQAQAREQGKKADYIADTNVAEAEKEMEVKKAAFKKEQDQKKAEAELAYKLQEAKTLQDVKEQEMQIDLVERQKQIEIEEKEILRREKQYDAEVKKKADADRYAVEQAAEADKNRKVRDAEAHAESIKLEGQAKAEKEKVEGHAQAEVIRQKGLAEAEAKDAIAEAMKKYGEAAIAEMLVEKFPEIAGAIAQPLSQTEKLVVIDSGSDTGGGANKVTGYVTDLLGKLPETVGALTGVDLNQMLKNLAEDRKENNTPKKIDQ
jgi:flotillin